MAYKYHDDVLKYARKWAALHREKRNQKARERYHKNAAKEKSRHYKWTQANRERLNIYMKDFRQKHREIINKRAKLYRAKVKEEVFQHYGGYICSCCSISEPRFLTIDHIVPSGKGPTERKQLYVWLKSKNFPVGFRVLCFNCNLGRDKNGGICPHVHNTSVAIK